MGDLDPMYKNCELKYKLLVQKLTPNEAFAVHDLKMAITKDQRQRNQD